MEQHVTHVKKSFGFLKTTAIGGLIFLLPLIVIGILVGEIAPIVLAVAKVLANSGFIDTDNLPTSHSCLRCRLRSSC